MKVGDLVKTPRADVFGFWWHDSVGIIVRPALPKIDRGEKTPCWHILIGTRTANLDECSLEPLNDYDDLEVVNASR